MTHLAEPGILRANGNAQGSEPMADLDIHTTIRGEVDPRAREYAEQKIARLGRRAHRPVLFARLELRQESDVALERPSIAKASLDISGRLLRAHVAAPTMMQAADLLEARLRRGLEILAERRESRYHDTGQPEHGQWRHGAMPAQRPDFFPRPPEERRLLRRSTFDIGPFSPEEAAAEMELLHHDFLLFSDAASGDDCVIHQGPHGTVGLIAAGLAPQRPEPYVDWIIVDPTTAPSLTLEEATERLNVSNERWLFFRNPTRNRGAVLYRRYDGHYGVIEPSDGAAPTVTRSNGTRRTETT